MFARLRARLFPAGKPGLLWVTLFYLLLTLVAARPVLANLDGVIIGRDNDVYINPWADWWTLKAWREPGTSLWHTDYLFYPGGASLLFHSFSHGNTALSLLLRPLVGPLPAFNLAILANYVLTGLAMYQLALYLTGSIGASLLAGIIFAFNPHSLYQSSHPVLVSIWCFPWATLYLMRAVRQNSARLAVGAGLFVFLGALTSTLLLFLLILWSGFLLAYLLLSRDWPRPNLRLVAAYGATAGLLSLPLVAPQLGAALFRGDTSFAAFANPPLVADVLSPIIPHWFAWLRRGVYFGLIPLSLLTLARKQGRPVRLWYLLLIVSYLSSIGPRPEIAGISLDVTLPWSLPLVPLLRNPYRLNILVGLALAMVVAYGWLTLRHGLAGHRWLPSLALGLVLLLTFGEYLLPGFPLTPVQVSPFYSQVLAAMPDDVVVATLPFGRQEDKRYLFYQTIHQKRITGGVISRPEPDTFDFILNDPLLRAGAMDYDPVPLPADMPAALDALGASGVDFLILDKDPVPLRPLFDVEPWRQAIARPPFYEDSLLLVYDLRHP